MWNISMRWRERRRQQLANSNWQTVFYRRGINQSLHPSCALANCQLLAANCCYCTVKFTTLVAVAPPLALLAVTVTAEVPAGVPGLCAGPGVFMLTPHPASTSNAATAMPAANLNLNFLVCLLKNV